MVTFGPRSTEMHLRKRKQELVQARNSIKWSTPKTAIMDTIQIRSLQRRDGEKTDTMSKRTLKTNIIKMCVIVKLVVSMNKHSNVY